MSAAVWLAVRVFNAIVLAYFLLINAVYALTSAVAFISLRRYTRRLKTVDVEELLGMAGAPPITVVAAAYNEAAVCVDATHALLTQAYADYEILFVNDGSKDDTLRLMTESFELEPAPRIPTASIPTQRIRGVYHSRRHPNLWVIDKENGGKPDAVNAGVNHCRTPLFCVLDADTLLERDALTRMVRPLLEDATVVGVGGIIRVVTGCRVEAGMVKEIHLPKGWLARFQVLEYLRAFLAGRVGWAAMNSTLIISGAFGHFRRQAIVDVGGYANDSLGDDMEMVMRLHRWFRSRRIPYRLEFIPDPVAWTECPETLRQLGRQRDRWQRGLADTLWRHRVMLFNPRYGVLGMIAFPYLFFLELWGAGLEALGYMAFALTIVLGRAHGPYAFAFLMVAIVLGIALSIAAVGFEELTFRRYPRPGDLLALFGFATLEAFGYRQLQTYWRAQGLVSYLRGTKTWGEMPRRGFQAATTASKGSAA